MTGRFEYWLGDSDSLDVYHRVQEASLNIETLRGLGNAPAPALNLLTTYGNVAMINVAGGLLANRNPVTQTLGITTYPDLRDALVTAAQDSKIDTILLNIDSPGGSAKGIDDMSNLLNQIKVSKRVVAHTNGLMTSAAYWMGASAHEIFATRLSTLGSIGVITAHEQVTKLLDQMGIQVTVFRGGEFKALGHPAEELSAKAKKIIQGRVNTLYNEFVSHVALSRGRTPTDVHDTMADGREFFGPEALRVGLIDGIQTVDALMAKLQKPRKETQRAAASQDRLVSDSSISLNIDTRMEAGDMATQKILSPEAVAAAAAEGIVLTSEVTVGTPDAVEPTAEPGTPAEPSTPEEPAAPAQPQAPAAPSDSSPSEQASEDSSMVSFLKTELSAANEKIVQLTVDSRVDRAQLDSLNATHAQMRTIVEDSANNKRIALGGSRSDLSSLSDEALLQQYMQTHSEFAKTFPVGGRSILPSTTVNHPTSSPLEAAGLRAVRPITKHY